MNFTPKNNYPEEIERVNLLKSLVQRYKVPEFSSEVIVERGGVPHSHPILTLNTREQSDIGVLKVLVHEQFHWYTQKHPGYTECIDYLRTKYPEDGEHNKSGTYPNSYWEHIIVCFNTRNYLRKILSEAEVETVYNEWQPYPTLEKKVGESLDFFEKDLKRFDMVYE